MQRTNKQNKEIWELVGRLAKLIGSYDTAEALMRDKVEEIKARDGQITNDELEMMSEQELRELRSTRSLGHEQANELITELGKGLTKYDAKIEFSDGEAAPTGKERWFIHKLARDLGWRDNTEARVRGFCLKVIKKPWPRDRFETNQVVEGLKGMLLRAYPRERIEGMIDEINESRLTGWEQVFLIDIINQLDRLGKLEGTGALVKFLEIWRKRKGKRQKAKV